MCRRRSVEHRRDAHHPVAGATRADVGRKIAIKCDRRRREQVGKAREVIGERIRDKIAASKKKGMWMGGVPPLGYGVQDHKLVMIDREADTVRLIFRRYAELSSVRLLKSELEARGIKSKSWTSASGRLVGGKSFARGALYLMLQNRTYLGEIAPERHPTVADR
jgi:hypothetical protein